MGDLEPDRGRVDVEGEDVTVAAAAVCASCNCFDSTRGVVCNFFCVPNLLMDDDLARLEMRSEGEVLEPTELSAEEDEDEERSAPLSLFFALIKASGVLIG